MRMEKAQNKWAYVCIFIFIKKDIRNRIYIIALDLK